MAVAVAVSEGGALALAVAGLTKGFFNHIQKDFLINVWGYCLLCQKWWDESHRTSERHKKRPVLDIDSRSK